MSYGVLKGLGWLTVLAVVGFGCQGQSEPSGKDMATFATVSDIFMKRCTICHGDNKAPKDGLDLRTYASVMKGSRDGAVVKPGDPAGSPMVQALKGENGRKRMPFGNQPPLPDGQIQAIEAWIKAGAKE